MNPSNPPSPTPSRKPGWLSHPLLSLLLGASWLALSHSLEPVQQGQQRMAEPARLARRIGGGRGVGVHRISSGGAATGVRWPS